jgi:hypothetical protein
MSDKRIALYTLALQVIVSLFGVFLMIFFIGEGVPNILHGKGDGLISFLHALFLLFAGCVVVWFRKRIGVLLLVIGGAAMSLQSEDLFVTLAYFVPFALPGVLIFIILKSAHK